MKVVYWSDLHCETYPSFMPFDYDEVPTADVLILAGDIGIISEPQTIITILQRVQDKFDHILLVAGNHEYWRGIYDPTLLVDMIHQFELSDKVHVFTKDARTFVLDNVTFIGATLWTDYDRNNPVTKLIAKNSMVDFVVTGIVDVDHNERPYTRFLRPEDIYDIHKQELEEIYHEIDNAHSIGNQVVVMTHHAPSHRSVPERFKGDSLNGAFVSELQTYGADFWIHGHIHNSFDYVNEDGTRILANPCGYNQDLNLDFVLDKYITI